MSCDLMMQNATNRIQMLCVRHYAKAQRRMHYAAHHDNMSRLQNQHAHTHTHTPTKRSVRAGQPASLMSNILQGVTPGLKVRRPAVAVQHVLWNALGEHVRCVQLIFDIVQNKRLPSLQTGCLGCRAQYNCSEARGAPLTARPPCSSRTNGVVNGWQSCSPKSWIATAWCRSSASYSIPASIQRNTRPKKLTSCAWLGSYPGMRNTSSYLPASVSGSNSKSSSCPMQVKSSQCSVRLTSLLSFLKMHRGPCPR